MRFLWVSLLTMACVACGPVLKGPLGGEGPKDVVIDNGVELEPEEAFTVKPLRDGPVLPRLKRANKKESAIEKELNELGEKKQFAKMLPLLAKLRKRRPLDPYLIDDQIWACVEVPSCKSGKLSKYLSDLKDYNKRYPKDVNRRITEMDLLDLLKNHKDLYRSSRRFTMHHPDIAEGWLFLGEQQLRFFKPNRSKASHKKASETKFRKKHNEPRLDELEQAIAEYVPPGYDELVAANEKEALAFEKIQNILLIRQDYVRGGSESDVDSGGDY